MDVSLQASHNLSKPLLTAIWLSDRASAAAADSRSAKPISLPSSEGVRNWFPPRIHAYFALRELGMIDQSCTAQGKGVLQQPPPFKKSLRKVLTHWFMRQGSLYPKNSKAPGVFLNVSELLTPLKPLYYDLIAALPNGHQSSYFSLVGRAKQALEGHYPLEEAFQKFGVPGEIIKLLLMAFASRVKRFPKDIDLRIRVPSGAHFANQIEDVKRVVYLIFQGFAQTKLRNVLNLADPGIQSECMELFGRHPPQDDTPTTDAWYQQLFAEHKYLQSETLKVKHDFDGTVRKITQILHPDLKISPPGAFDGAEIPVEVIVAGSLIIPQLHRGSMSIPLDNWLFNLNKPFYYDGEDVWTGLFCMVLRNCTLVKLSRADEQAWCRLVLAYSEGESCFRLGEEDALVEILFRRVMIEVANGAPSHTVTLVDALLEISKQFESFWKKHEGRDPISFTCLYYNAVRTLNGQKPLLTILSEGSVAHSFEADLITALMGPIPFKWLDAALQAVSVLCIGLCPRKACPQIELDVTNDSFALRLWMERNEIKRSLLIPLNISRTLEIFQQHLHEPWALEVTSQMVNHLFSDEREISCDSVAFLMELGLDKGVLQTLANFLLDSSEPSKVYLGLLFGELLQKIELQSDYPKRLLARLPTLLAAFSKEPRVSFLISLQQLLSPTPYSKLLLNADNQFSSELFETTEDIRGYLENKLIDHNELWVLLSDATLNEKTALLLDQVDQFDYATAFQLIARVHKNIAPEKLWSLIQEIMARSPSRFSLDLVSSLNRLADLLFSADFLPIIQSNPHPETMRRFFSYINSQTALTQLSKGNETLSFMPAQLTEAWLSQLEFADLAMKKKFIPTLLEQAELLNSLTGEHLKRLAAIFRATSLSDDKLKLMAEAYLSKEKKRNLGFLLFHLLYQIFPNRSPSLLPLKYFSALFSERGTPEQRRKLWNQYQAIYDQRLGIELFPDEVLEDLLKRQSNPLLSLVPLLMASKNNDLILLGNELMAAADSRTESVLRITEKGLPELVEADFNAAADRVVRVSPNLDATRLFKWLKILFEGRTHLIKEGGATIRKLMPLIPKVLDSVTFDDLGMIISFIDQVDDVAKRAHYLKLCPKPLQGELIAQAWLRFLQKWPTPQSLGLICDGSAPLASLTPEEEKEFATCLAASIPQPLSKQDFDQVLRFLQTYKSLIFKEACQAAFEVGLAPLLVQHTNIWQNIYSYLLDRAKFTLLPNYLELISSPEKKETFYNSLQHYIRLKVQNHQRQTIYITSVSLICKACNHLSPENLAHLIDQLLTHCAPAFSESTLQTSLKLLDLLPIALPFLDLSEPIWSLLEFQHSPAELLELLRAILQHKPHILERLKPTLLSTCNKIAESHTELVWQTILQIIRLDPTLDQSAEAAQLVHCIKTTIPNIIPLLQFDDVLKLLTFNLSYELKDQIINKLYSTLQANPKEEKVYDYSKQLMPYLADSDKAILLSKLIDRLHKNKLDPLVIQCGQQWRAFDWFGITPKTAGQIIQSALNENDTDTALQVALHPRWVSEIDSELILKLLDALLLLPNPSSMVWKELIIQLLKREQDHTNLFSLIENSPTPFNASISRELIDQCKASSLLQLLLALCLQSIRHKEYSQCLELLQNYSGQNVTLLIFKCLTSQTHSGEGPNRRNKNPSVFYLKKLQYLS